jgi:hypothetical protein
MTSTTILYIALLVFGLMIVGLYLSAKEFLKASTDPSEVKGADLD